MAEYSLWVVEYATSPRVDMVDIVYGARGQGTRRMPYAYVVLQSKDHVAMVDVGYNHVDFGAALAELYDTAHWHGPRQALALCGLKPEDVGTVFITHAHFDHFGNVEAFPNARFYVAAREIERSVWALSLPERMKYLAASIDPGDLIKGAALARAGRLELLTGDKDEVLPGIDLYLAPDTHSFESLWCICATTGAGHRATAGCWRATWSTPTKTSAERARARKRAKPIFPWASPWEARPIWCWRARRC